MSRCNFSINHQAINFELPWPPSVNHYWIQRVAGKRVIQFVGPKGKKFREEVSELVKNQLAHCDLYFKSPNRLHVSIQISPPDRRRRDVDNLAKATLDALEHAGVYDDDAQIDYLQLIRDPEDIEKGGRIHITIGQLIYF